MITIKNQNLIKQIFSSFALYDLQTQFHELKNKISDNIRLEILSYNKIFKSIGRSKVIFTEVDNKILPPAILPCGNLLSASRDGTLRYWDKEKGIYIYI
jgi:hypothetical protein